RQAGVVPLPVDAEQVDRPPVGLGRRVDLALQGQALRERPDRGALLARLGGADTVERGACMLDRSLAVTLQRGNARFADPEHGAVDRLRRRPEQLLGVAEMLPGRLDLVRL